MSRGVVHTEPAEAQGRVERTDSTENLKRGNEGEREGNRKKKSTRRHARTDRRNVREQTQREHQKRTITRGLNEDKHTHLEEELDTLNGGHDSLGDSSADT